MIASMSTNWQIMDDYADDYVLCEKLFEALKKESLDGVGITREAFRDKETRALQIVEAEAINLGLTTKWDEGQNLVVALEGSKPDLPFIAVGSHMDSVPQGGNYDGAAGVLAGLAILASFKKSGFMPQRNIRMYALRGEESSRFGKAYMGSLALTGGLTPSDLTLMDASGKTLEASMEKIGLPVDKIRKGAPLLDVKTMAAWIELHIEQGPILIARQQPAGVVSGIRGNIRHKRIECVGEAAHSGAAPKELRRDAVFASADLIMRVERLWDEFLKNNKDLVVTSGVFGTDSKEHAIARVPGWVGFSFDARSQDWETLEQFYEAFYQECRIVEQKRGVTFLFDKRLDTAPARIDSKWMERLQKAAQICGISDTLIPSGAGHDAAVFSNAGVPSAMVFIRNENGSHNPFEAMKMDDFLAGVAMLRIAIKEAVQ